MRRAELLGLSLRRAAAEHEQHGGAEVRGDAGVVGELGRAADIGVVAADDHDGVALGLDGLVALDDRRERGIRIVAHVVVGDADALVVGEVDAVVGEQHLEHVVGLGGRAGDRAEDADPRRRAAERVEHAEGDRGLARVTFCRRDEDALRHGLSLRARGARHARRRMLATMSPTPGLDVARPPRPDRTRPDRPRPRRQSAGADRRCRTARRRLARAPAHDPRVPRTPSGALESQQRETYDRGNGATVLLYDRERRTVLLTRQFRFPVYVNGHPDGMLVETAAGLLDDDDPETAIRREAAEETGVEVGELEHVFDVYMSPGSVTERIHFFAAPYDSGSARTARPRGLADEGEEIEILELDIDEALAMIRDGRIQDAKTIMLLQWAVLDGPFATGRTRSQLRGKVRLSANPAEPGYPCYVSVLGELAWMPPRGELTQSNRSRAALESVSPRAGSPALPRRHRRGSAPGARRARRATRATPGISPSPSRRRHPVADQTVTGAPVAGADLRRRARRSVARGHQDDAPDLAPDRLGRRSRDHAATPRSGSRRRRPSHSGDRAARGCAPRGHPRRRRRGGTRTRGSR